MLKQYNKKHIKCFCSLKCFSVFSILTCGKFKYIFYFFKIHFHIFYGLTWIRSILCTLTMFELSHKLVKPQRTSFEPYFLELQLFSFTRVCKLPKNHLMDILVLEKYWCLCAFTYFTMVLFICIRPKHNTIIFENP